MGRQKNTNVANIKTREVSSGHGEYSPNQQHMDTINRSVLLHGEVNEETISGVISHMLVLANVAPHKPINLIISTYGGSVDEMFSLYDVIKFLPCPVYTVAIGKVMSAGVLLLASGEKGKRSIGRSSRIMIHPISGGFFGNVFEYSNEYNEFNRLQKLMVDAIVSETSMSNDKVEEIMKKGHDFFITAEQAIKLGIVDKYLDSTIMS